MLSSESAIENAPILSFEIVNAVRSRELQISGARSEDFSDFTGEIHASGSEYLFVGKLSSINASALRKHLPWLNPQAIGLNLSAGVGDRLGLATSGHARAFSKYGQGVLPIFAQQSAREMHRLYRTPQEVMDDVTFGLVESSWQGQIGSDADHLKSIEDIDSCLAAGFSMFTLDPGDSVVRVPTNFDGKLGHLPWGELEDSEASMLGRYVDKQFILEESSRSFTDEQIRRAAFKYSAAVASVVSMYRHLMLKATHEVEVEIAIDETSEVTTPGEHIFIATELKRLGVKWVSFAPRYIDGFEKAIEFKGSIKHLAENLKGHFAIAQALGPYKLSIHTGSDKFSIYSLANEVCKGLLHLKTSGTSYLEALSVCAQHAPELFREIYQSSYDSYAKSRSSYQVSADLNSAPLIGNLRDDDLKELLILEGTRQILHVGYGAALTLQDSTGDFVLRNALQSCLIENKQDYDQAIEHHIGRHLSLLNKST